MGFSSWEDGHGGKLRAQKSKVMQWQTGESQALAPFHCDLLIGEDSTSCAGTRFRCFMAPDIHVSSAFPSCHL